MLICDRSLDPFEFPIDLRQKVIMKFGDEDTELSDEIIMIEWNTQRINIAQLIYEYIGLEIPLKKLHPRYDNEVDTEDTLFYSSENEKNPQDPDVDPRWETLKSLKKK